MGIVISTISQLTLYALLALSISSCQSEESKNKRGENTKLFEKTLKDSEQDTQTPLLNDLDSKTYIEGQAISPLQFTNSGLPIVECTVSPTLPNGMSIAVVNQTCQIAGQPTEPKSTTKYIVKAKAKNNNTNTATVSITINASNPPILVNQADKYFLTTIAIPAFDFANSGASIVNCTITPSLPTGLILNTSTCAITGTPTAPQSATTHIVTASAADGSTDTATVKITVTTINPVILADAGSQNFVNTVPSLYSFANSGYSAVSCSSSPNLPDNLSININAGTCVISGIPNGTSNSTTYTITATAADGSQNTASIDLTIIAANPPDLTDITTPIELMQNEVMAPINFTNSGSSIVNCSSNPALPDGLSLNSTSCTISGTPTVIRSIALYTLTATAADGSTDTTPISISVFGDGLDCPTGYIPVSEYTDSDTGTVPAFCVMKYEAKNDGNGNAISQATGAPWGNVQRNLNTTLNGAWKFCTAINIAGYEFDLISNAQWQSLARQIERYEVNGSYVNWENNSILGANSLNQGSTGGSTLEADLHDGNGCSGTATPINCNNTWHMNKRTHALPNGSIIWDLSGNLWEWVRDDSTFNYGQAVGNHAWSTITADNGNECLTSEGCHGPQGKAKAAFGPYGNYPTKINSPYGGLGFAATGYSSGGILRGVSGIFTAGLHMGPSGLVASFGFRCVATPDP